MQVDCDESVDCQLGVEFCEACRLNDLEQRIESAQLRAELEAELEEEDTLG